MPGRKNRAISTVDRSLHEWRRVAEKQNNLAKQTSDKQEKILLFQSIIDTISKIPTDLLTVVDLDCLAVAYNNLANELEDSAVKIHHYLLALFWINKIPPEDAIFNHKTIGTFQANLAYVYTDKSIALFWRRQSAISFSKNCTRLSEDDLWTMAANYQFIADNTEDPNEKNDAFKQFIEIHQKIPSAQFTDVTCLNLVAAYSHLTSHNEECERKISLLTNAKEAFLKHETNVKNYPYRLLDICRQLAKFKDNVTDKVGVITPVLDFYLSLPSKNYHMHRFIVLCHNEIGVYKNNMHALQHFRDAIAYYLENIDMTLPRTQDLVALAALHENVSRWSTGVTYIEDLKAGVGYLQRIDPKQPAHYADIAHRYYLLAQITFDPIQKHQYYQDAINAVEEGGGDLKCIRKKASIHFHFIKESISTDPEKYLAIDICINLIESIAITNRTVDDWFDLVECRIEKTNYAFPDQKYNEYLETLVVLDGLRVVLHLSKNTSFSKKLAYKYGLAAKYCPLEHIQEHEPVILEAFLVIPENERNYSDWHEISKLQKSIGSSPTVKREYQKACTTLYKAAESQITSSRLASPLPATHLTELESIYALLQALQPDASLLHQLFGFAKQMSQINIAKFVAVFEHILSAHKDTNRFPLQALLQITEILCIEVARSTFPNSIIKTEFTQPEIKAQFDRLILRAKLTLEPQSLLKRLNESDLTTVGLTVRMSDIEEELSDTQKKVSKLKVKNKALQVKVEELTLSNQQMTLFHQQKQKPVNGNPQPRSLFSRLRKH